MSAGSLRTYFLVLMVVFTQGCIKGLEVAPSVAIGTGVPDGQAALEPWINFVGTQYNLKSYSTAVRDIGVAYQYGYDPSNPDQAAAYTDFAANVVTAVQSNVNTATAMTAQVGGLGSGRSLPKLTAYLDSVAADGGASARAEFKKRAKAIAEISGSADKFYWQIGNEINSDMFSENVHLWLNDGLQPSMHDTRTIPLIVEYFVAPAVAGIEGASQEVFGKTDGIRMMLGSLAVSATPGAQIFLNELLDYTVVGTYAPTLAGKKVYDLIDTISIHYMMAGSGLTWKTNMDALLANRIGQGRIKRIISTEEVGAQTAVARRGMTAVLKVLSRYLFWWQTNNLTSDVSRFFIYGHGEGTPAIDTEIPTLYEFTGSVPLTLIKEASTFSASSNVEKYEFRATKNKRILVAFPGDGLSATLSNIQVSEPGHTQLSATAILYGPDVNSGAGKQVLSPSITNQGSGLFSIDVGSLSLASNDLILILIESF